jgi:hypothetical protein
MTDEYVPWGQREGWSDVVPVEQDDGPSDSPVIQIPYTAECMFGFNCLLFLTH